MLPTRQYKIFSLDFPSEYNSQHHHDDTFITFILCDKIHFAENETLYKQFQKIYIGLFVKC